MNRRTIGTGVELFGIWMELQKKSTPVHFVRKIAMVKTNENPQETLALLKILALGNQEIEAGKVTQAGEVARRLKAKKKPSVRGAPARGRPWL